MLVQEGQYLCALCGEPIMAVADQRPLVMIKASSGEPNLRIVMLEGKQLHACPVEPRVK